MSMVSLPIILCVLIAGLCCYIIKFRNRRTELHGAIPPGPMQLPFIGNLHQLNFKYPFLAISEIAEKYGNIYSFKMGHKMAYVVSDLRLGKEMFVLETFSGRFNPGDGVNDMFTTGQMHGIINTEGEHWEQLRRFTLRQLRDFGFGKSTMESLIMEELQEVIERMKSAQGNSVEGARDQMSIATVNSLWKIVSGQRCSHGDTRLISLHKNVTKSITEAMQKGGAVIFIPKLKDIIPEWSGYNGIRRQIETFREPFLTTVAEHKETYSDEYERDFIDAFLKKIKSTTDPSSAFYEDFGERNLVGVIADLFMAGTETTATTIEWAFLYLATFTQVQEKLQEELDRVVGNSRHCLLSDRPNTPYAEAVLSEVLRFSSIVPPGVPHRATSDQVFHGWSIPAGTAIFLNLHAIHKSKKIWGDPENFRPERFLSEDGHTFKKHEALIPFSTGKRQCVGETLAKDSLYLYLTNIFHRFEIHFDATHGLKANPGLGPKPSIILMSKPFYVTFKDRQK